MALFDRKPKNEEELRKREINQIIDVFFGNGIRKSPILQYTIYPYVKIDISGRVILPNEDLRHILRKEMLNEKLSEDNLQNRLIELVQLDYSKIHHDPNIEDTSIFKTQEDIVNYYEDYDYSSFLRKKVEVQRSHSEYNKDQIKRKIKNVKLNNFDSEIRRVIYSPYFIYKLRSLNLIHKDENNFIKTSESEKSIMKILESECHDNKLIIEDIKDRAYEVLAEEYNLDDNSNLLINGEVPFNFNDLGRNSKDIDEIGNKYADDTSSNLIDNKMKNKESKYGSEITTKQEFLTTEELSEVNLIECPDCKRIVIDDEHYCRFCGHDFNEFPDESSGFLKTFKNTLKKSGNNNLRYCTNCKEEISMWNDGFCPNCETLIPPEEYDENYIRFINQFIVPLSNEYNVNFRKKPIHKHFNITKEQELHIIYVINEKLKKNDNVDVLSLFESTLKETRANFKNIGEVLLDAVRERLTDMFNSDGISASDVVTVKSSYYDTIETPVVQNKHGGLTKGAATLGFGLIGLAATSGVETTTKRKQIYISGEYAHYQITFNSRGVALKSYNNNSASKIFDSKHGNINQIGIRYEDIHSFDSNNFTLFLESGETFKCPEFDLKYVVRGRIIDLTKTYDKKVNDKFLNEYTDKINDEVKPIVAELINEQITSAKDAKNNTSQQSNVDIEGLEKIMDMYKEGLLTDDEFTAMKQNIIGNNNSVDENKAIESTENDIPKFCGNCGAEILKNYKFCIQCGNKIK